MTRPPVPTCYPDLFPEGIPMVASSRPIDCIPEARSLLNKAGIDPPSKEEVDVLSDCLAAMVARMNREDQARRSRDRETKGIAAWPMDPPGCQ